MLLNCGVGEDSWESLGLQGDPTSPFWRRSALGFLWKNDAKAETPVLWPPHAKSWLIGKDCDAGRDWGQEEKGTTEDEMAGWHHWLDGHESEWTLGIGDGQGGLVCCNSWGHKELDMTEWLNWTELVPQLVKIYRSFRRPQFDSWVRKIPWRRDRLSTLVFMGFPGGLVSKESTCNARDAGLIPGSGRSPWKGNINPLQYSCLKNPKDRGAW